jgi:hypothetical protein
LQLYVHVQKQIFHILRSEKAGLCLFLNSQIGFCAYLKITVMKLIIANLNESDSTEQMSFSVRSGHNCNLFFSFYVIGEPAVHYRNFLLCCPSQRSARSQVPSEVATHQEIGSQLWAGKTPDWNPLHENSLACYH